MKRLVVLVLLLLAPLRAQTAGDCQKWIERVSGLAPEEAVAAIVENPRLAEIAFDSMMFEHEGIKDPVLRERDRKLLNLIARVAWVRWGRADLTELLASSKILSPWEGALLQEEPGPELQRQGKISALERRRFHNFLLLSLLLSVENYSQGLQVVDDTEELLEAILKLDPSYADAKSSRAQLAGARLILTERMGLASTALAAGDEVLAELRQIQDGPSQMSLQLSLAFAARRMQDYESMQKYLEGVEGLAQVDGNREAIARFVAATLRTDLAFQRDADKTAGALEGSIQKAWAPLKEVNPLRWTGNYWLYGAEAMRIWTNILGTLPPKYFEQVEPLLNDLATRESEITLRTLKIRADIAHPLFGLVYLDTQCPIVFLLQKGETYMDALDEAITWVDDPEKLDRYLADGAALLDKTDAAVLDHEHFVRRVLGDGIRLYEGSGAPRLRARLHFAKARVAAGRVGYEPTPEQARAIAEELERARTAYRMGKDEGGALDVTPFHAWCTWRSGEPDQARRELKECAHKSGGLGRWRTEFRALFMLGEIEHEEGELKSAIAHLETAVNKVEKTITRLGGTTEAGDKIREQWGHGYDLLARLRIEAGDPVAALATLDRGQQVQVVSSGEGVRSNKPGLGGKLRKLRGQQQQIRQLQSEVEKLEVMGGKTQELARSRSLLADTRAGFFSTAQEIRQADPRLYDATLSISPLEFGRLQKSIPPNTAVVQYFPTDTKLYYFVMTSESFRLRELEIDWRELHREVTSFRRQVQTSAHSGVAFDWSSPEGKEMSGSLTALYTHLIEPVEEDIQDRKVLVVLAARSLHYLPFQALARKKADGRLEFLVERKQVAVLWKATDFFNVARPIAAGGQGHFPGVRQPHRRLAGCRRRGSQSGATISGRPRVCRPGGDHRAPPAGGGSGGISAPGHPRGPFFQGPQQKLPGHGRRGAVDTPRHLRPGATQHASGDPVGLRNGSGRSQPRCGAGQSGSGFLGGRSAHGHGQPLASE